ncbi:UNVERIFIED_CONTAM: hypothetical protein HHA_225590 [Hammondia hammondi]|eukprot:XP_008881942.1 hypothetical protein HHA_225590 [Hammondia hammondi]
MDSLARIFIASAHRCGQIESQPELDHRVEENIRRAPPHRIVIFTIERKDRGTNELQRGRLVFLDLSSQARDTDAPCASDGSSPEEANDRRLSRNAVFTLLESLLPGTLSSVRGDAATTPLVEIFLNESWRTAVIGTVPVSDVGSPEADHLIRQYVIATKLDEEVTGLKNRIERLRLTLDLPAVASSRISEYNLDNLESLRRELKRFCTRLAESSVNAQQFLLSACADHSSLETCLARLDLPHPSFVLVETIATHCGIMRAVHLHGLFVIDLVLVQGLHRRRYPNGTLPTHMRHEIMPLSSAVARILRVALQKRGWPPFVPFPLVHARPLLQNPGKEAFIEMPCEGLTPQLISLVQRRGMLKIVSDRLLEPFTLVLLKRYRRDREVTMESVESKRKSKEIEAAQVAKMLAIEEYRERRLNAKLKELEEKKQREIENQNYLKERERRRELRSKFLRKQLEDYYGKKEIAK